MRVRQGATRSPGAPRSRLAALILGVSLALVPPAAVAQMNEKGEAEGTTFFFGLSAGVCTLVYTPLKLVYALAALPVSGLVYLWSVGDTEMAGRVMRSGTQGTFVLTPQHLRGEATWDFVGAADEGPGENEKQRQQQRQQQ